MACSLSACTPFETTTTEDMAMKKSISYATDSRLQELKRDVTVAGHLGQPP